MPEAKRNCHTCALAKDQGVDFSCRFKLELLGEILPFYPVVAMKVTKTAIRKDRVPNRNCPAWRAMGKGGVAAPAPQLPPALKPDESKDVFARELGKKLAKTQPMLKKTKKAQKAKAEIK